MSSQSAWALHPVFAQTGPMRFSQVDVFAEAPCRGNPLAVVHDAEGLTDEECARFANWTNLSETTFLLPPTDPAADYRVRIFTVERELPFAGHPTLGSARAWLAAGGVPATEGELVQECGAGLIRSGMPTVGSPSPHRPSSGRVRWTPRTWSASAAAWG